MKKHQNQKEKKKSRKVTDSNSLDDIEYQPEYKSWLTLSFEHVKDSVGSAGMMEM